MNFLTVTIVIFIVALIGVFAVALIVYLSSLVKSAYQIKIEMRNDLEEGLKRADEELNKRSRWIKRELLEEIERIKSNMQADITNRGITVLEEARKMVAGSEEGIRHDLAENTRLLNEARDLLYALEHKVKALRREAQGMSGAQPAAEASPTQAQMPPALPAPASQPMPAPRPAAPAPAPAQKPVAG
ncbi:MAG: hypothetical protein HQL43_01015 [Alphaproteobacteria bacterium]|nr:hypothetical protein [Alphaproteobacteria bacterium]